MKILVITHKVTQNPESNLFNVFGAVKKLSGQCDVLVVGHNLGSIVDEIAKYKVVSKVLKLDDASLEHILVENIAKQISEIVGGYTHVLIAADSFGKNLLPRVAGVLELGQISEVSAVISPNIYQKFIYAGNVLVEVEALDDIKLLTIRCTSFNEHLDLRDTQAEVEEIQYTNIISNKIKFVTINIDNKPVDLSNAKVVVTGGRSLGSKEAFDTNIRELAKCLNAGVGSTRAAVEAGYANNDAQVGQTGKIVAPLVYLAFGVSGAVQHIAGMKDSKTVIAINIDQNAPIFEYADYGLVGDLFEVIPQLLLRLQQF